MGRAVQDVLASVQPYQGQKERKPQKHIKSCELRFNNMYFYIQFNAIHVDFPIRLAGHILKTTATMAWNARKIFLRRQKSVLCGNNMRLSEN